MAKIATASVIKEFGGPEVLAPSEFKLPRLGSKQVLIRMKAAGINEVEQKMRRGQFRFAQPPFVIGIDGAGVIEETGNEVTKFKKGDRVFFMKPDTGSYSTLCLAPEDNVYHLHKNLTFEEGAILPVPYMTAHRALLQLGKMKQGDLVLVQGGSGAVGLAAIQIAKGLGASRVISTAGTEEGIQLAYKHGADVVRNYKSPDFKQTLKDDVGSGLNLILETNADVNFDLDLDLIARHGKIVIVGKRGPCQCDIGKVLSKETTILGCALLYAATENRQDSADALHRYIEAGWLKPFVGKIYKLDEAPQSHVDMTSRKGAMGKDVILIEK
ncbi:quinone oxidoreductase-like [Apostichopus japonicus]|uniref:quinone oxidoreductase-like n=1 Tax=Stichopus japonicus TaxID=307972 RepID=UPI003AB4E0E4